MKRENVFTVFLTIGKTPEVFNVDNPVQAGGAARGWKWRTAPYNSVGVELSAIPVETRHATSLRVLISVQK